MRELLLILLLGISTLSYSQQKVELCDNGRRTFTYYSSSSVSSGSWLWLLNGDTISTTSSNITLTWDTPGEYQIEVQFDSQCPSDPRIYKVIVTECAISAIYFPNAFTPNDDNVNNFWGPKGYNIAEIEWSIWNRWGEMIFEGKTMDAVWDGSYKGNGYYVQDGVYVYKAEWKDVNGIKGQKIGHVVLIR